MAATGTSLLPVKENNKLRAEDFSVHDWYRFVLSYPPHLVRDYLSRFGIDGGMVVLDPFCGTGTTLVECKKLGVASIGIEANPVPCFASRVKVDWSVDPEELLHHAERVAEGAAEILEADGFDEPDELPLFTRSKPRRSLRKLSHETEKLLLANSIGPLPLHRTLVLLEVLQMMRDERFARYERLALAKALVFGISNLTFGPEVGVGRPKDDVAATLIWMRAMRAMVEDLRVVRKLKSTDAIVHLADSREALRVLQPNSVDAVITSPPYPNEKDYTRTTRLATATKEQLREEVVLLRWAGTKTRTRTLLMNQKNVYTAVIERIFQSKFKPGMRDLDFEREEIVKVCNELKLEVPKNLGDLVYSFRYRAALPESIQKLAGEGETWIIRPTGRAKYRFVLVKSKPIAPNENMSTTKVPDATPGVVAKYALSDEQALLARVRYNRLVDIFTGVACYSLQNHLRTTVPNMGQVETDEIYIGVDKKGAHYVFPVQAKGGTDKLSIVQIEQDLAVCAHKFPSLICRPIAAQFMAEGVIALFEFEEGEDGPKISAEKHYKLVPPDDVTEADLEKYRQHG